MMTPDEHLAWCKKRALAYLDAGEPPMEALTSMFSDVSKHPEMRNHPGIEIGVKFMFIGKLRTPAEAREFIEGFH